MKASFAIVAWVIVSLAGVEAECGQGGITTSLIHAGNWGVWKGMREAPSNYFACGAQVRYERDQGCKKDDTAANGLRMKFCHINNWYNQKTINIYEGVYGDWKSMVDCPPNSYIAAMQVRAEGELGTSRDDTELNGLRMKCKYNTNPSTESHDGLIEVYHGNWGEWGPVRGSSDNDPCKFVVGAEIRFEDPVGTGSCRTCYGHGYCRNDDTAWNGLKLKFANTPKFDERLLRGRH